MVPRANVHAEGAGHLGNRTLLEAIDGDGGVLGCHVQDLARSGNRGCFREVTKDPAQQVRGVDRLRHQDPTSAGLGAKPRAHADGLGGFQSDRLRQEDVADRARLDEFAGGICPRVVDAVVDGMRPFSSLGGGVQDGIAFGKGGGQRLLDYHMVPGFQDFDRELRMEVMGQEDCNDVGVARKDVVPRVVDVRYVELSGAGFSAGTVRVVDARNLDHAGVGSNRTQVRLRNRPATKQGNAHGLVGTHRSHPSSFSPIPVGTGRGSSGRAWAGDPHTLPHRP